MGVHVIRKGALDYLTADTLEGTAHCFSTRYGGVSKGILASLNLGVHRGDEPDNVLENYRILGSTVGFRPEDTVFTRQIHSDLIDRVGREDCGRGLFRPVDHPCDGLVTNEPNVVLTVFSADCTPVLLYDPVVGAIGAVHAGWRGTAAQIAGKAARRMCEEFGCQPEHIRAAIGPCISQCCFETDADVPEAMRAAFGDEANAAIRPVGQKYYVNLKELNALALRRAGVNQIDVAAECTACDPDRFWSHRRVGGERGSLAAMIMLKGETV
ncbi:MAG: peptidoglycan editing factor PgeF [Oscillospiraceae bacterium]|nr:peptidoglycan editing factor PgeF [Oscillospiraceae bacterium]